MYLSTLPCSSYCSPYSSYSIYLVYLILPILNISSDVI